MVCGYTGMSVDIQHCHLVSVKMHEDDDDVSFLFSEAGGEADVLIIPSSPDNEDHSETDSSW